MVSVDARQVKITDPFWSRYRELVRKVMIPYQWKVMNDRVPGAEKSHVIANFRIAAGLEDGGFYGFRFQDSDLAKWLEAVAHSLAWHPDPALEALADGAIELVGRAQGADGYLNTYFTIAVPELRWKNERDGHELYVSGHFIEAAVAYYRATGKRALLDIMMRNADHIDSVFGPEEGKKHGYPGHQVIEMALVQLHEATGEERYLRLAQYFIDERGKQPNFFDLEAEARGEAGDRGKFGSRVYEYTQSHLPVREQRVATGHAVRAVYMYAAMADLARISGDEGLASACRALWADLTRRQMFITGGIGQQEDWEGFSRDWDLPNDMTYNETCASVGLVFWAKRMSELELKGDYYDVAERALYNGALAGMSLDGKKYFYANLLESVPEVMVGRRDPDYAATTRRPWFACACCPPNLARLIASLSGYILSADDAGVAVQLYIGCEAELECGGARLGLRIEGSLPWSGGVRIALDAERPSRFALRLRIPGWCSGATARLGGAPLEGRLEDGYLVIDREWRRGDLVELELPMPIQRIRANPLVRADAGRVALTRGPLVYCFEEADNGAGLWNLTIPKDARLEAAEEPGLLGGVVTLSLEGRRRVGDWGDELYRSEEALTRGVRLRAVPYFVWDNRGENEMSVWLREE
ncbi:MAG TPA: beta-L-arabinofuranosidase domain-containing protein [Rectinemataceae bacterium]|nr:beta-L-arabinofuranosidase domain-containing protein [Rectinemataceae bacterium]